MARGRKDTGAMSTVQRYVTRLHVAVLKASRGRMLATMFGSPVFVLVTRGRKTGRRRETPLLYLRDGEDIVVVASNGGSLKPPVWYLNLVAAGRAEAMLGGSIFPVTAREVHGEEKRGLWERLVEMYPSFADYQRKTDREIPVLSLTPEKGTSWNR